MKKVTAVLPARNCRRELHRCLSALSRGDYVPEVIVVDDGSDDGTQQMIKERWPQVTFLSLGAHTGYAHAANAGLRLVRTQYAFLIRPDLQPGRKCVDRLLKGMKEDVFCAVPVFLTDGEGHSGRSCGGRKREKNGLLRRSGLRRRREETFFPEVLPESAANPSGQQLLVVEDGCAMYRMQALEETGWLDERHFDGLEAFDLSLRAALNGWKTVEIRGAAVRPLSAAEMGQSDSDVQDDAAGSRMLRKGRSDMFRLQLAAGNARYVFYKNLPGLMRILGLPFYAAADAAQIASFAGRGEFGAYRTAMERGKTLCGLERDRRAALDGGVSVWPENLSDASFLGMDEAAERIYPLYLAQKEPVLTGRIADYLRMQMMLAAELPRLIRLLR